MAPRIGYLLPTREQIMEDRPEAAPLLALAERAESLGYDSVWVGDSLLARPRHEPLALLAAAAARTRRVELGTAVLLPALRNPVLLAHQAATIDQVSEGRLILGVGIGADVPSYRADFAAAGVPFEKRVGRLLEGIRLCRALWSGENVDWDGRWQVKAATLAPRPHRPGGPPIWIGGNVRASIERAARHADGWFPNGPNPALWGEQWSEVKEAARALGRDPAKLTGAVYLTLFIDDDAERARRHVDAFLERYYGVPAAVMRRTQDCYGGPAEGAAAFLAAYAAAGVEHFVLRFAGDHERHLAAIAGLRSRIGG